MEKLREWVFYIFLFLLPTQLGRFFFLPYTYIHGIRIDYLAPVLYLTDVLFVFLLILYRKELMKINKKNFIFVVIFLSLHSFFALNIYIALYNSLQILEIILLFYLLQKLKLSQKNLLITLFLLSIFQLSLGLWQIISQSSIQGLFYLFGERYFTISTPGIAKVSIQGMEILRPYGTFSHPNSLSGFFLLLYTFILFAQSFTKFHVLRILLLVTTSLLVIFSFSKITIITYSIVNIIYALLYLRNKCTLCLFARIIMSLALVAVFFSFKGDPDSINKRILLTQNALEIIMKYPFTGVGLGNYLLAQQVFPIPYSYYFLQPVHNVFLLVISELGILFSTGLGYILFKVIKKYMKNIAFILCISVIGFTGFFDHYWITLHQNMLLLAVISSLSLRKDMLK